MKKQKMMKIEIEFYEMEEKTISEVDDSDLELMDL